MGFSNLRIGMKLGLAFIAMVLLSLLVGVLALVQLSDVHEDTHDIATNWLPSVHVLGEMRATANRLRASEVGLALSESPEEKARLAQDVLAVDKILADQEKVYAPMVTPQEVKTYEEFKQSREAYMKVQAQLLALAKEGGAQADTAKLLYGDSQKAFIAMAETIGRLAKPKPASTANEGDWESF